MRKNKQKQIEDRVILLANYIIDNNATVRATAKAFNISKSTVYKDVTLRLNQISLSLYTQVQKVLQKNKKERAVRGGTATKKRYLNMKK